MLDIHTHKQSSDWPAIVHVEVTAGLTSLPAPTRNDTRYSLGIHPWNTGADDVMAALETQKRIALADNMSAQPLVAAIGECGLDRMRGPEIARQIAIFEAQIKLAAQLHLPLIIHCVRAWGELLSLRQTMLSELSNKNETHSSAPTWIVHGFRGKPALAKQLLDKGIHLSYGEHFNPESLALTPPSMLHIESDDSPLSFAEIHERIRSQVRHTD